MWMREKESVRERERLRKREWEMIFFKSLFFIIWNKFRNFYHLSGVGEREREGDIQGLKAGAREIELSEGEIRVCFEKKKC